MKAEIPGCARCSFQPPERICQNENGKAPPYCTTTHQAGAIERSLKEFQKSDIKEFAKQASIQEGCGYADRERGYDHVRPLKPRILEIIEFAERMTYRRLGLAFCIGLRKEAREVEKLLTSKGFEVVSSLCKIGRTSKASLGVRDDQQIRMGTFESMCNPIAQAFVMNEAETDFNVLMGLCVGHDSLFFKYSQAPCTVFAVKDRLLGHNPLAAIYTIDSYYRSIK
ncbi:MAG: DUF1847 domain-containing protein [Thermodesulfobacteriota bacterium]